MNGFLESPEFQADLKAACQGAFARYGDIQSTYSTWEDLRQAVLIPFLKGTSRYRGDASWKTFLTKIATNLLIDSARRDKAQRRYHVEIDWDKLDFETLRGTAGRELEFRMLFRECLGRLSDQEHHIFIECRLKGRSTRVVGAEMGVSATTVVRKLARAIIKLRECFES